MVYVPRAFRLYLNGGPGGHYLCPCDEEATLWTGSFSLSVAAL